MKEIKIYGKTIAMKYNRSLKEWTATFTEKEIKKFAREVRNENRKRNRKS